VGSRAGSGWPIADGGDRCDRDVRRGSFHLFESGGGSDSVRWRRPVRREIPEALRRSDGDILSAGRRCGSNIRTQSFGVGRPCGHCRGPASPGAAKERSAHRGNYLAPTPSSYHQAGLSTSTVSQICQVLGSQSELWKHRDLGPSIPTVDQVPPAIRRDAGAPAVT
jgi:hypothetical protein